MFNVDSPPASKIIDDALDLVDDKEKIQQLHTDLPAQDDHPEISFHALARFTAPQAMWVRGFFKKIPLRILIDSSRTHNFIHPKIVKHATCFVHPCSSFKVTISNGGTLPCRGKCHNVCISIGDYNLCSNMFYMPVGGCDMILGTECLRTLGLILWDFA